MFENKQRIIQEFVPGKQVTLAHLIASCEPHPTPPAAAQPSIEPPRQTSIMAPRSTPVQADWAA